MLGIHYIKTRPTDFVLHYAGGKVRHSGAGKSFWYHQPTSSIAIVPISSSDVPFIFTEVTSDFQSVTVQGQLTYRVADAAQVAQLLDFTLVSDRVHGCQPGKYASDVLENLPKRVVYLAQEQTRAQLRSRLLGDAVQASDDIAAHVLEGLRTGGKLAALGIEVLMLSILAIKPTPDMARALEADAREQLLQRADNAIYLRRNSAVEQERHIRENELNTELAVEAKQRQLREAKVEADLAVQAKEQQMHAAELAAEIAREAERAKLVTARANNARVEADAQSYALEASLKPLHGLTPELMEMLALQSADPRRMMGMALRELAQNAAKIGQLSITPDLFESIVKRDYQKHN